MTLEQACEKIMGVELARSIIADLGLSWAIVAATAHASTDDDPEALAAIRTYLDAQKAKRLQEASAKPVEDQHPKFGKSLADYTDAEIATEHGSRNATASRRPSRLRRRCDPIG